MTDADPQGATTLDLAADLVRQAAELAGVRVADLLIVGMCVPGPIDRRSARLDQAVLPGWHELAPAEELGAVSVARSWSTTTLGGSLGVSPTLALDGHYGWGVTLVA